MLKVLPIMLKNSPIMLALCFMLSSPYYAENYAGIIDAGLCIAPQGTYHVLFQATFHQEIHCPGNTCYIIYIPLQE